MKTNANRANTTVPAFVEAIIKPPIPGVPEKAQIAYKVLTTTIAKSALRIA